MRGRIFGDRATVYRFDGDGWTREVLSGVSLRVEKAFSAEESGLKRYETRMRMRVPALGHEVCPVKRGDVLVEGEGPEIGAGFTMEQLRREGADCCTVVTVADNTKRPRLKHWRIDAR